MHKVVNETNVCSQGSVPVSMSVVRRAAIVNMSGCIRENIVVGVSVLHVGRALIDDGRHPDQDESTNECEAEKPKLGGHQ